MNRQSKAGFQLPTAEDDLWHQVVVRLLEQRDMDEEQAKNPLRLREELAFHSRFCGKPLTRAFAEDTATWLAKEKGFGSPRDKAQEWLHDLEWWELLMRPGSGNDATYEFAIPMLDEYFAARHLAARWAEEDNRYRAWLPYSEGWWERGGELRCPNPHCHAILLPFCDLLRQAEYEEMFLLIVSLLKEMQREERFLNGLRNDLNLMLKALSRCRHKHPSVVQDVADEILTVNWWLFEQGLAAVGQARVQDNLDLILSRCMRALLELVTLYLGQTGDGQAVELLRAVLRDTKDFLIVAAQALMWIGYEQAIPVLQRFLDDPMVRAAAQRALEEIERRTGSENRTGT